MPSTGYAPREGTAWLRAAAARGLARVDQLAAFQRPLTLVIAPLVAATRHGTREDRTCDRCGTYTPPGPEFFPIVATPRPDVVLVGGLCDSCHRLEFP